MVRRLPLHGFTLIEMLITISISVILGYAVYQFVSQGFEGWRFSNSRAQSQEQVRQALDTMTVPIREARAADSGAYAVAQAEAAAFTFYANIDADTSVEQVQFSLNGTNLQKRVIEPTGVPVQYPVANAVTSTIIPNVRSLAFEYFDRNYTGTGASLAQPVSPLSVRLVRISLTVDDDPSRQPEAVTSTTSISLRNLKDNL